MKILIVDDNPVWLKLARAMLSSNGQYEIVEAHDGLEGFMKILSHRPDVVILDELMPKMTGYEVVKK